MKRSNNNSKRRPNTKDDNKSFRRGKRGSKKPFQGSGDSEGCEKSLGGFGARGANDVSWYTKYPELLAATSRLAFPYRPGMHISGGIAKLSDTCNVDVMHPVPGVMRIEYAYTIGGDSGGVYDPASVAAQRMYANIRKRFSSNLLADAPDLMMYALALDQIHAYIAWLKRMYCTINSYSPDNHMYPEEMFKAQFAGAGSYNYLPLFLRDKIKFYGYINSLVNMVNQFEVPMVMDLYERHRWMNQYVYSDIDSVRGQMFVFAPTGFFSLVETPATNLQWISTTADDINWNDPVEWLYNRGKQMIRALAESEDAYTINGYIQRAYEGVPTYRSALQAQDEILSPVPGNDEVLNQIHNLTVCVDFQQASITQDPSTNVIVYHPSCKTRISTGAFVDLEGSDPDGLAVTTATRLTAIYDTAAHKLRAGTEVVTNVAVTAPAYFTSGDSSNRMWEWFDVGDLTLDVDLDNFNTLAAKTIFLRARLMAYLSSWRKAPKFIFTGYVHDQRGTDEGAAWLSGELDNVTTISADNLSALHQVCLFSEFDSFGQR